MKKLKLLIADDEKMARETLARALKKTFHIVEAEDGQDTWRKILEEKPELILLDLSMPKIDGIQVLEKIKILAEQPLAIMITAHGSERKAVMAIKAGAYDYITKPFQLDELRNILAHAAEKIQLQLENRRLKEAFKNKSNSFVGESTSIKLLKEMIEKVAPTDVTVLITGESGTGKELVAKNIHKLSSRPSGPFIAVNCAAIPNELIESELFGYKKGAFTGAEKNTPGKFEQAHGGTLFLDEIADMSKGCQAKVLRVIEEGRITPLGSSTTVSNDARIIIATNRDLPEMVSQDDFRKDLYYRIKVVEISVPPLRERGGDILVLAEHFLNFFSSLNNKYGLELTPEIKDLLIKHRWPGNVRELRNVIKSLVVLATDALDPKQLESKFQRGEIDHTDYALRGRDFKAAKQSYMEDLEKSLINEALMTTHGNISRAAELLGMKRQFLQQKIKMLKIDARKYLH